MNLSSSEWLTAILLVVGVVVLVIGLVGRIRWRLVLVGGLLTLAAVALIFRLVTDEGDIQPSPSPTPSPTVAPSGQLAPSPVNSGLP